MQKEHVRLLRGIDALSRETSLSKLFLLPSEKWKVLSYQSTMQSLSEETLVQDSKLEVTIVISLVYKKAKNLLRIFSTLKFLQDYSAAYQLWKTYCILISVSVSIFDAILAYNWQIHVLFEQGFSSPQPKPGEPVVNTHHPPSVVVVVVVVA